MKVYSNEIVFRGHPDKVCDQISAALLDEYLRQDETSRCGIEVMGGKGKIFVTGEVTSKAEVDVEKVTKRVLKDVGYSTDYEVIDNLGKQSADIALGTNDEVKGAGDQGMMFGYACDETPELMPMAIALSHRLARRLTAVRKDGTLPWLRPDGKTQVTVVYEEDRPVAVDTVVISTQHDPEISQEKIREALLEHVVQPVIPSELLTTETKYFINPTGRFVIGGPAGDTGLTGRKIIVDTYGGYAPHGGGAFSGKDPTKVDRSAAYMARYVAKNLVASGIASRCQIEIAYAIGVAKPVSVLIDTFGTGKLPDERIAEIVNREFDMRPAGIIKTLDLLRPIYKQTAAYGHFGRTDVELPWEKLDMADKLRGYLN